VNASGAPDFAAGIDVGGTKVSSALFSHDGTMFARSKTPLDRGGPDRAAGQVVRVFAELEEAAGAEGGRILAASVCVPGIVYRRTGLVWAPNVPGWVHYPLRDKLAGARSFPVSIESDRAAYVSGEAWLGAARGLKDVVFLAVGTGIGAGIMADGRIVRGAEDISGAVGWFALNPDFRAEYADMGCFEAEASGTGVGRRARRLLEAGRSSAMIELAGGRVENVTAETVAAAARAGDPAAREVIETTASYLAMGIANIVSILNPEMIVLGGGLFQSGDLLLEPVRRGVKTWAQPLAARDLRVEVSRLGEDAGLCGCGKLAWDSLKGE
jgi:glucokinase